VACGCDRERLVIPALAEPRHRSLFAILVAHLALVCALGQHYCELHLGLYPTEIVLGVLVVFGIGAIRSVAWDSILVWIFLGICGGALDPRARERSSMR
jgi:hypothetical protein